MKAAVIIVLYKTSKNEIDRLKEEVKSLNLKDYSLHLIDNTHSKKGFAQGVNEGIKLGMKQNADYFIIANPDISIKNLKLPDNPPFDIFSFSMNQNNRRYYCGYLDKWRLSSMISTKKPRSKYINCTFITGSLMIINKQVFEKIGLFNEDYFMYYEDVDFCIRAAKNGFTVGIDSLQSYSHYESSKTNPKKDKYLAESRMKFFLKYSNLSQKIYEVLRLPKTIYESRYLIKTLIKSSDN